MNFLTVLFAMIFGAETIIGNSASVVLRADAPEAESVILQPGSFDLCYVGASVAQGSYSGMLVTFKTDDRGAGYDELTLFIPSHQDFSVGYESSLGRITSLIPVAPFTFRAEETAGIEDRFGRPRPMKMEISHWQQVGKQHWSKKSIEFTACQIEVESMAIEDNTLRFSGTFTCQSEQSAYSLSGTFSVIGGELGVSKVD